MTYEELSLPPNAPLPGFYYHYKHDPAKGDFDYAYEMLGIGHYTEDDLQGIDALFAIYRPLYESAFVFRNGRLFDVRPLAMFMEQVVIDGKEMPRFTYVEDWPLIERLSKKRDEMYFL